jgi:hypothetical protein
MFQSDWPSPSAAGVWRYSSLNIRINAPDKCVRFEVFTAVTMNNGFFWMSRRVALVRTDVSEKTSASTFRVTRIAGIRSVYRLLVTAIVVSSSLILVTLIIAVLGSSQISVPTRATRRNNQEDGILRLVYSLLI